MAREVVEVVRGRDTVRNKGVTGRIAQRFSIEGIQPMEPVEHGAVGANGADVHPPLPLIV